MQQNHREEKRQNNMVIGWNGTSGIFKNLIEKIRPATIIEVGSWHGQSSITMALAVKELGIDTKIYCVDTWLGALEFMGGPGSITSNGDHSRDLQPRDGYPQVYYTFLQNIKDHGVDDIIIPVPQTSLIAARWFKKHGITAELVYLDASHDAEDVELDVKNYLPICTNTLFGDDYLNRDYTVKDGVLAVLPEESIQVIDKNFWVCCK